MTSVIFHPVVKYSQSPVLLEIEPTTEPYIKFHFVSWRGKHIDGCNLFYITNFGIDPFSSIRNSFGGVDLEPLKIIGVDMVC